MSEALDKARLHSPQYDWFEIDITMRRSADGLERTFRTVGMRDTWLFMWGEGNFACDCNRYLFFERSGGHEPTDEEDERDGECGDERYEILRVTDAISAEPLYDGDPNPSHALAGGGGGQ